MGSSGENPNQLSNHLFYPLVVEAADLFKFPVVGAQSLAYVQLLFSCCRGLHSKLPVFQGGLFLAFRSFGGKQ